MPPIRERDQDVVHLAQHFIDELTREQGLLPMTLSDEVVAALGAHLWPGNARERRSVMQSAVERCTGDQINVEHLSVKMRETCPLFAPEPSVSVILRAPNGQAHDQVGTTTTHGNGRS